MMHNLLLAVAGLGVGIIVGLTGVGGGALMTPILTLVFGIDPLAAVSSDLLASLVMKPVGSAVHARRGTINIPIVAWLTVSSVPAAFCGVLVLRQFTDPEQLARTIKTLLGMALLLAVAGIVTRMVLSRRRPPGGPVGKPAVRPLPTLLVGAGAGLMVGLTSVGSGSLVVVALMFIYPAIADSDLVGTDLLQAIPMVGAAAVGHAVFGDLHLNVTIALLVGALPGVYLGARMSARQSTTSLKPVLAGVLFVSALRLLGAGNATVAVAVVTITAGLAARAFAARRERSFA